MNRYYVYWYRLIEFNNPHCEGYIGITNNMERRHKEHCRSKGTHFANAISKYGLDKISYEVLHETDSRQEALDLEAYYRPDVGLGWNTAKGGEDTLASVKCRKVKLYHKDNPEKLRCFDSIDQASKELGITASRIAQALCRNTKYYGFDGWAVLIDESTERGKTLSIQEVISIRVSGAKRNKPSHFKGMTNRWSEEDKKRISDQHRGKVISDEQKEVVRNKNRAAHSSCKSITLVHQDNPEVEHTYHSIAEASRELSIPLSRLKSKAQRKLNVYGKDGWKIIKLGAE
ncbi:GIY-YIG nuclease family protein [Pseudorhizobium pelagicum]|nr:GIY-YIG nuclease family protein [Pseudorhizobium pelagicum]